MSHSHNKIRRASRGFMALVAVVMLALGTLAFSLATVGAAYGYSDMVYVRELRIQARQNASACLDSVALILGKDIFMNGTTTLPEFGCDVSVTNLIGSGSVAVNVAATLSGVIVRGSEVVSISPGSVAVLSKSTE